VTSVPITRVFAALAVLFESPVCPVRRWVARFHDLRHFSARTLIAANLNPKVIQARLGHATIAETMGAYGHLFPESDELGLGTIDAILAQL
jgi:integrase